MYVCVYVCMYIYVCMYVCIYIYICIWIYIHIYIQICIHVHTYIHTCIHTNIHTYIHTNIHISIYTCVYALEDVEWCQTRVHTHVHRRERARNPRMLPRLKASEHFVGVQVEVTAGQVSAECEVLRHLPAHARSHARVSACAHDESEDCKRTPVPTLNLIH